MENEMMNFEEVTNNYEDVTVETGEEKAGLSGLVFMAIGAASVIALKKGVDLGKKLWDKHKAKKELRQPDEDAVVEVTDEDIAEVVE